MVKFNWRGAGLRNPPLDTSPRPSGSPRAFSRAVGRWFHGYSSRRAGAPRLRAAVEAYRIEHKGKLDQHALAVLRRLTKSSYAADAFKSLKLKDCRVAERILTACIEAEQLARTFSTWLIRLRTKSSANRQNAASPSAARTCSDSVGSPLAVHAQKRPIPVIGFLGRRGEGLPGPLARDKVGLLKRANS